MMKYGSLGWNTRRNQVRFVQNVMFPICHRDGICLSRELCIVRPVRKSFSHSQKIKQNMTMKYQLDPGLITMTVRKTTVRTLKMMLWAYLIILTTFVIFI